MKQFEDYKVYIWSQYLLGFFPFFVPPSFSILNLAGRPFFDLCNLPSEYLPTISGPSLSFLSVGLAEYLTSR
ncbi:hypothetical protein BS17DRAFT_790468 [Gyrodon lividus]|nr:hypothetical protein BS17DRAFT_790468 [Gyrodon lividus]